MSINKVILLGNVGQTPTVRCLENNGKVANFSLATSEKYKDKNGVASVATEWHNISAWAQRADFVEKWVTKGAQIYVEGRLRSRRYVDSTGTDRFAIEVVADNIQLLGSKQEGSAPTSPAAQTSAVQEKPQPAKAAIPDDDDLPF